MTENIGHHGHDDQSYDYRIEDAEPGREIEEWIDAITRRPWFAALKSLPGEGGFWIGTEEELIEELKARMLEEQDDGDALVDEETSLLVQGRSSTRLMTWSGPCARSDSRSSTTAK